MGTEVTIEDEPCLKLILLQSQRQKHRKVVYLIRYTLIQSKFSKE